MKTSDNGIAYLKHWEKFRPSLYRDAAYKWTIGYGHLIKLGESYPKPITEEEAQKLLAEDVIPAENAVNKYVTAELNQNQFDGLVSFAFNCGSNAFKDSTLLKKINLNSSQAEITKEFMRWINVNGVPCDGLINRRKADVELYFS